MILIIIFVIIIKQQLPLRDCQFCSRQCLGSLCTPSHVINHWNILMRLLVFSLFWMKQWNLSIPGSGTQTQYWLSSSNFFHCFLLIAISVSAAISFTKQCAPRNLGLSFTHLCIPAIQHHTCFKTHTHKKFTDTFVSNF